MRILALSDIHIDHRDNRQWVEGLSSTRYAGDVLILGGDVSHRMEQMEWALACLRDKFAEVFFVPGNHDVWLRRSTHKDSLQKLEAILGLCRRLGIKTSPERLQVASEAVWVVPMLSWYVTPEEGADSLFLPKPAEDPSMYEWGDDHFVRWKLAPGVGASDHFLEINRPSVERPHDAAVISFSHFLPRAELMFAGSPGKGGEDVRPEFNFSRYAGSRGLERQIRQLGSRVHVYGHQHRNRRRRIDGIVYVSHCLGYRHEREGGLIRHPVAEPLAIWEDGRFVIGEVEDGVPPGVRDLVDRWRLRGAAGDDHD